MSEYTPIPPDAARPPEPADADRAAVPAPAEVPDAPVPDVGVPGAGVPDFDPDRGAPHQERVRDADTDAEDARTEDARTEHAGAEDARTEHAGAGGAGDGGAGDATEFDDPARLAAAVEAVLFVVDTPVAAADLAEVFGVPVARMEGTLTGLRDDYDRQARGFALRELAGGWRLYTREEYASYVERYVLDGQQTRLTQAALETLAVVAYRQPVARSRIAAIRGVGVDGVMRTLLSRGLVEECGTEPTTGGNLYRTTPLFLEKLGLRSLDELPSLAPLLPEIDAVDDVATSA